MDGSLQPHHCQSVTWSCSIVTWGKEPGGMGDCCLTQAAAWRRTC